MKKKIIIKKESTEQTIDTETTETTFTSEFNSDSENFESDEYYTETDDTTQRNGFPFVRLRDSKYIKPRGGTKQDLMTKDEIINRIQKTIPLKTMEEKKILTRLPYFKTWLRYFNTKTRKFRIGGVLMKVVYPDYLILGNINNKISWTVQIKDCIFYVTDPRLKETEESTVNINNKERTEEDKIKDKLYVLYKQGKLSRIE